MTRKMIFILVSLLALSACNMGRESKEAAGMDIRIARYDRLQFEYVTMNNLSALQRMNTDYPQHTKLLIEDVLAIGAVDDERINERMQEYLSDTTLLRLMNDVQEKFKDLSDVEQKLAEGFKRLKKEVPALSIPYLYAQFSALNQSVVVSDSLIGFSLDKYMGTDYPLYKRFYYDHQSRTMNPDRIVPDCFIFYLMGQYSLPWHPRGRTLLDHMMHRGKINWVVAHILEADSFEKQMGYEKKEEEWCKANRKALWKAMQDNNHLNATDPLIIRAYLQTDAYMPVFGEGIPPRIGVWMGMQIIDAYMKKHPETTIRDLLEKLDYRMMLASADFNP